MASSEYQIRIANTTDLHQLHNSEKVCFGPNAFCLDYLDELLTFGDYLYLYVVTHKEQIIGALLTTYYERAVIASCCPQIEQYMITNHLDNVLTLISIAVLPEYRG